MTSEASPFTRASDYIMRSVFEAVAITSLLNNEFGEHLIDLSHVVCRWWGSGIDCFSKPSVKVKVVMLSSLYAFSMSKTMSEKLKTIVFTIFIHFLHKLGLLKYVVLRKHLRLKQ